MSLPEKFTSIITHEKGASIVGRASDGKIYTVSNEGGVVYMSGANIERTVLHTGNENVAKLIVDSYFDGEATPTSNRKRHFFPGPIGELVVVAAVLFVIAVGGTGAIALYNASKTAPAAEAVATQDQVSVEEANQGHRPEEAPAPAPEQPTIEIPSRVTTTSVDPAAPPAELAAAGETATDTDDQATGAAGIAERTSAAIDAMNGSQAEARELIAESGTEAASSQLAEMKEILATLTSGGKLTPEAIEKLPHELAANLRAAGALQSLEDVAADTGSFTVLRLPPTVVDQYMDADGVPTIPDANGWVSTGGVVRVPLPGGGDVSRPEHLLAFGLEP